MTNFKMFLFLSMVLLSVFSCTKDDVDGINDIDAIIEVEEYSSNVLVAQLNSDEDDFELGCFSIETPFQLTIDGNVVTIETVEDIEAAFDGLDEDSAVDFVYPLTINYEDGSTAEVADGEALGEAFATCIPDGGWSDIENGFPAYVINEENSCYNLVYPVSLTDLDGEIVTVADEAAFIEALSTNPLLFFTFPLTLTNAAGEEVTAEDDEELFGLFFDCEGTHPPCDSVAFGFGTIACYDVVFPINMLTIDANGNEVTITIEDEDGFNSALLEGIVIGFAYPLTLSDEEGNQLTINSEEELGEAIFECDGFVGPGNFESLRFIAEQGHMGGNCYLINYPITINVDGTAAVVNTPEESVETFFSSEAAELVFPIEVTLPATGDVLTLNSIDDISSLLEDCE